jgi:DNA-binding CsgD family transcriptional regulator
MMSALASSDSAITQLRHTLESAARHGHGSCLVVEGPAGIGKSRQLELARSEAVALDMEVVTVEAADIDRVAAFCPLAAALECEQASGTELAATVAEMGQVLGERAGERAVLVTIDDADVVGELTALALRVLVPELADRPIVWLMARRTCAAAIAADRPAQRMLDWLIERGARRMRLAPLSHDEIAGIFTDMVGARPDDATVLHIARCGGNPFLTVERIRAMAVDELAVDGDVAHLRSTELPGRFLDRVSEWLRELSCDALRLLDAAAVLGRPFTVHQVAGMLCKPAPDIIPAVAEVVVAGFLVDDGSKLAFQHELLRDAIYEGLYGPVRLALHREACEVLRTEQGSAAEIAEHLINAGRVTSDEGIDQLRDAVDQVAASSPGVAAELLLRTLDLVEHRHAARPRLVVDAVRLLALVGRTSDARRLYEDGRRVGLDLPDEVRQMLESAVAAGDGTDAGDGDDDWPAVPTARRPEEVGQELTADRIRVPGLLHSPEPRDSDDVWLPDAPGEDPRSGRISRALVRSVVARAGGDLGQSVRVAREAVVLDDALGDQVPCQHPRLWLGSALASMDRLTEAHAVLEMGLREWERSADERDGQDKAGAAPLWHYHLAELCLATGRLDDACAEAEAAVPMAESAHCYEVGSALLALLGQLAIHRDDLVSAENYLDQAEQLLPAPLGPQAEELHWRKALLLEAQGERGKAARLLDGVVGGMPDRLQLLTKERRTGPALVRLFLGVGEPGAATAVAGATRILRDRNPTVPSLAAAADHAVGLAGEDVALLRDAVESYQRVQRPLDAAAAMEDLASAETHRGDPARATRLLERARDTYFSCAARRDATRVTAALRGLGDHGDTKRPRGQRGAADLTEAELRVVRLVADGLTNRQIAHQLFLSPHTVDSHLRHSFAKLGVNSRVELTKQFFLHHEFDDPSNHAKA